VQRPDPPGVRKQAAAQAAAGRRRAAARATRAWSDLRALWDDIRAGRTTSPRTGRPAWTPGKAFEDLILTGFRLSGAEVRKPFDVNLDIGIHEQIDGAVYAAGLSCLVEAKDYGSKPVDITPIAKLRNQLLRRHAGVVGLFFSRSGYTEPARVQSLFLGPQAILLWDSEDIQICP